MQRFAAAVLAVSTLACGNGVETTAVTLTGSTLVPRSTTFSDWCNALGEVVISNQADCNVRDSVDATPALPGWQRAVFSFHYPAPGDVLRVKMPAEASDGIRAAVRFVWMDSSGLRAELNAVSGSVRIDSWDVGARASGGYDLRMSNGEEISGRFSASVCPGDIPTPHDGGCPMP
jgi:hypothetical protein